MGVAWGTCPEYLKLLDEKNKILRRLKEQGVTVEQKVQEQRKTGFTTFFSGANSGRRPAPASNAASAKASAPKKRSLPRIAWPCLSLTLFYVTCSFWLIIAGERRTWNRGGSGVYGAATPTDSTPTSPTSASAAAAAAAVTTASSAASGVPSVAAPYVLSFTLWA